MNADLLAHAERNLADACADFRVEILHAQTTNDAYLLQQRLGQIAGVVMRLQDLAASRADSLSNRQVSA